VRSQIIDQLREMLAAKHRDPDFAAAFYDQIAAPKGRFESWSDYGTRLRASMAMWLSISETQRKIIVAGVTEEGVPWRGDDPDFYIHLVDEAQRMREIGKGKYLEKAKDVLRAAQMA